MKPIHCLYCNQETNNEAFNLKSSMTRIRCYQCKVTYSSYNKDPVDENEGPDYANYIDFIEVRMDNFVLIMNISPEGDGEADLYPKNQISRQGRIFSIPVASIIHLPLESLKRKVLRLIPFS